MSATPAKATARGFAFGFGAGQDRYSFGFTAAFAGVALGHAVQIANGSYAPEAIRWLSVALCVSMIGLLVPAWPPVESMLQRALRPLLLGGIAWQLFQLTTTTPAIYLRPAPPDSWDLFHIGTSFGLVAAVAAVTGSPAVRRFAVPVMLASYALMGFWLIRQSPEPFIDVFFFHRQAADLLVHGGNPYAMTIDNIYGNSLFYGEKLMQGNQVAMGYIYPPLTLLLSVPGHLLGGDYRYSILAAIVGAGAFIAYCRPGPLASAAAALVLFTPRTLFVLEQGWTDSFVLFFLAMSVFAAYRARSLFPYALAGFFTSKQYAVVLIPTVLLLRPLYSSYRALLVSFVKGLAVALTPVLAFTVWNAKGFFHNLVMVQMLGTFRPDSMNYFAHWYQLTQTQLPSWIGFVGALAANLLALARAPRTPAGFAGSVAFVLLVFVAFNRQAFCNYYYFVLGAMLCALAATAGPGTARNVA